MHPGDRVVFDDPYDGPSTGTVIACEPGVGREALIAFVAWDDGTPEDGVFVDDLRMVWE